jgi:hypothetical protein
MGCIASSSIPRMPGASPAYYSGLAPVWMEIR